MSKDDDKRQAAAVVDRGPSVESRSLISDKPSRESGSMRDLIEGHSGASSGAVLTAPEKEENKGLDYYEDGIRGRLRNFTTFNQELERLYESEPQGTDWAIKVEHDVRQAVGHMPGAEIRELDCKASLCKFSLAVEKTNNYIPNLQKEGYFVPLKMALGEEAKLFGTMENISMKEYSGFILNLKNQSPYLNIFKKEYLRLNETQPSA